jgi:hypothetical protein
MYIPCAHVPDEGGTRPTPSSTRTSRACRSTITDPRTASSAAPATAAVVVVVIVTGRDTADVGNGSDTVADMRGAETGSAGAGTTAKGGTGKGGARAAGPGAGRAPAGSTAIVDAPALVATGAGGDARRATGTSAAAGSVAFLIPRADVHVAADAAAGTGTGKGAGAGTGKGAGTERMTGADSGTEAGVATGTGSGAGTVLQLVSFAVLPWASFVGGSASGEAARGGRPRPDARPHVATGGSDPSVAVDGTGGTAGTDAAAAAAGAGTTAASVSGVAFEAGRARPEERPHVATGASADAAGSAGTDADTDTDTVGGAGTDSVSSHKTGNSVRVLVRALCTHAHTHTHTHTHTHSSMRHAQLYNFSESVPYRAGALVVVGLAPAEARLGSGAVDPAVPVAAAPADSRATRGRRSSVAAGAVTMEKGMRKRM